MTFNYPVLVLSEPAVYQPKGLVGLVRKLQDIEDSSDLLGLSKLPKIRCPGVDRTMVKIERGETNTIGLVEWMNCLQRKAQWDAVHPTRARPTSEAIWDAATEHSWLKQKLLWMLALSSGERPLLAVSLIETFATYAQAAKKPDRFVVCILRNLIERRYRQLLRLAYQNKQTPRELFRFANLPVSVEVLKQIFNYTVDEFKSQRNGPELILCLDSMSSEQQIEQVNRLLLAIPVEEGCESVEVTEWLREHYGSRSQSSKWGYLSDDGKSRLRQWIGTATWQEFEDFVAIVRERLTLNEKDDRQLESRQKFWSNYRDRFERLRILLPQESLNCIDSDLKRDVGVLRTDGNHLSEVCIFDFGTCAIVEVFRGLGSEIRLFSDSQYPKLKTTLFEAPQLSLSQLRAFGGEVHDHVYLWQFYAEKWLRKNGVLPNKRLKTWAGLPNSCNLYHPGRGLPHPSAKQEQKRRESQETWQQTMKRLERDAKWLHSLSGAI